MTNPYDTKLRKELYEALSRVYMDYAGTSDGVPDALTGMIEEMVSRAMFIISGRKT